MATFEKTPGWLDWCPRPSTPRFTPPPGAVDAHCHIFGPGAEFPYAPERKYTPCDASKAQLFALRDHLGFARNVVVQATCHGADNRAMADTCRASGGRARGVATVHLAVTDRELRDLHDAVLRHPQNIELLLKRQVFGIHIEGDEPGAGQHRWSQATVTSARE